jgi:hypothetical protein
MDDKTIALLVTAFLAIAGFIVKYLNDLAIARRKDRLERINQQLRNLYGPLFTINEAADIAWREFRKVYRSGKAFFNTAPPPSDDELRVWRLWMSEVFMPLNLQKEIIITGNGDLIFGEDMPESFIQLCAHVSAYKPVLKNWELGNYSEHTSLNNYPENFNEDVKTVYKTLRKEQAELINSIRTKEI